MDEYHIKDLDQKGVEDLIEGIVRQAVRDWKDAKKVLDKQPESVAAERSLLDCERFFLSPHFIFLTGMDGRRVLFKLEEEYERGRKH